MRSYFKGIMLFGKSGEKRVLPLIEGVNIITGESKSGKSAILEIIDYCLRSSKFTIPKGVITNFTYIYSVLLMIGEECFLIGRRSFQDDGRSKMFFRQVDKNLNAKEVTLANFDEKFLANKNWVMQRLENSLGLRITDMTEKSGAEKEGKASIRNMMSYLLQHQNLIANKFALFYRFDQYEKREQSIKQFPVFAGWVDQEYYSLRLRLDKKLKELKMKEKQERVVLKVIADTQRQLSNRLEHYYSLIGEEFPRISSLEQLIRLAENLPDFSRKSYISDNIEQRYNELESKLQEKVRERQEMNIKINSLERSEEYGEEYVLGLKGLAMRSEQSEALLTDYSCPICGTVHNEINEEIVKIKNAKIWLHNELSQVNYHRKSFGEQIRNLKDKKSDITKEIRIISAEMDEIENVRKKIKDNHSYNNQVIYAKARIDHEIQLVKEKETYAKGDLDEVRAEIQKLEDELAGYNLGTLSARAESFLSENMNRIAGELDFEEEFYPIDLNFDLDNFDLYHWDAKSKSKVFLSEMGSGANWLSCHLALFISLMHFFATQKMAMQKESVIPTFLFLDQPSQVYFPDRVDVVDKRKDRKKQKDIQAVEKIYSTILKEVDLIEKKTGYKPQIIITDHVDHLELGDYVFDDYVRARWRGKKLI